MPEGWDCVAFGDVVDFPSKRYPATAPRIPYLSFKGLLESGHLVTEDGRSDGVEALPGDTVISRQGHVAGWIGKKSSLQIPAPIVAASTLMVLRPRRGLDGDFLSLLASWGQFRASVLQAHGERTSASKEIMSALQVCIPPEIEQRRIVHLVGSIDRYIASLQTQVEVTRAARSALLAELLSNPADDWRQTTFGDVAEWSSGKSLPADRRIEGGKYRVFGASSEIARTDDWLIDFDAVLVGRVGAVGVVQRTSGPVWVSDNALIARPSESLLVGFLSIALECFDFSPIVSGNAQPVITQGRLKQQSVVVPPPAEQRRIVELVGSVDHQVRSLEFQLQSTQTFRGSAISELLSGERLLDESYDMAVSP